MARKFLSLPDTAKQLGISEDELNALRDDGEIRAYRDGKGWKFREEEVEKLADFLQQRDSDPLELEDSGGSDLISDSQVSRGSTVIGDDKSSTSPADSDLKLEDESDAAGGSDLGVQFEDLDDLDLETESAKPAASSDINLGGEEELALGEEDLVSSEQPTSIQKGQTPEASESTIDLAGDDDEELVLGAAADSDITLDASESGISLGSPSESGLSLEEPLELGGSAVESFELGEDDAISLEEDDDGESPTQLQPDDDFLLSPLDEEDDDLSSDSQVIALDEEDPFEAAAEGALDVAPLEVEDEATPSGAATLAMASAPGIPEAPYSFWNLTSLFCCILFLMLTGMMMFDLMRNMWSWNQTYTLNSSIMDWIIDTIGGLF